MSHPLAQLNTALQEHQAALKFLNWLRTSEGVFQELDDAQLSAICESYVASNGTPELKAMLHTALNEQ